MKALLFNYSLTDITPEEPLFLAGYANRKGLSGAVHRRLTSRCVLLRQEDVSLCLIVNDLMDVDPEIIQKISARISQKTGLNKDSILITSIHSHSTPEVEYGRSEANDRYIDLLIRSVSENAVSVINNTEGLRNANMRMTKVLCGINIARRDIKPEGGGMAYRVGDPDGLRDEEVGILQLADDSGERKVTLFNYACHPVTLGYESNFISTDYPGKAREIVELEYGGMSVFMNGAAGDLNPREPHNVDPPVTDRLGEQLGEAIISSDFGQVYKDIDIKLLTKTINVPFRDQIITKEHITSEARRKLSDITEFFTWSEMLSRWEKKVHEMIDRKEVNESFPFKINVLKLGKAIIFFTQGELFVKYQLALKKNFPDYHVFCVAYVHGTGAYIPTADVFENKGYEADQAYIYEILPSPLSPQIEQIYLREAINAINELIE
jgi:neutral ceramidase